MIDARPPSRPLQAGLTAASRPPAHWVRVYHREPRHISDGTQPRSWGPVGRFDPHPGGPSGPREHPHGPTVHYSGDTLPVALAEAFRGAPVWSVCPAWRAVLIVAVDEPVQDLAPDGAVALGAPADLGHGHGLHQSVHASLGAGHPGRPTFGSRRGRPLPISPTSRRRERRAVESPAGGRHQRPRHRGRRVTRGGGLAVGARDRASAGASVERIGIIDCARHHTSAEPPS